MIPTFRPSLGPEERANLDGVLSQHWLGRGALTEQFEERLSDYLGGRHVLAVSSGTAALHLALLALELKQGDEVIVPSLTFVASVQAILLAGGRPVFCEVSPATLTLDLDDARRRLSPRVRALMPVHYGGQACDLDAVYTLALRQGLRVVEDAAPAFGSSWRGRRIGSFGDIACFSFDPIKNITCGQGGAVVTADDRLARRVFLMRNLGIDGDSWSHFRAGKDWTYDVVSGGLRYDLGNLNAAIGVAQWEKMEQFRARKLAIARAYERALAGQPLFRLLERDWSDVFPFSFVVRVLGGRRDSLRAHLHARGIGTMIQFRPNHLQPEFASFHAPLPVTEALAGEILSLPLFVDMTDAQVQAVIDALLEFTRNCAVEEVP